MKFQCACGAKYALDIVPGMQPVQFVCQSCGQDYSAFINEHIRKELGENAFAAPAQPRLSIASAAPAASAPPPEAAVPTAPAAPAEGPRLRINRAHAPEAAPASAEQSPASKYCTRHKDQLTTEQCQLCKKPICPQCMEMFGPFCSPFCRNKVEGVNMNAPVHIGRKFEGERRFWRKTGRIATIAGTLLVLVFGFWIWYAWIGSVPHKYFSIRWDDISHSGGSWIVGKDQIVFLHGGTLARYDLHSKKKVWSLDLVTSQMVDDALKEEDKQSTEEQHRTGRADPDALEIPRLRQKHARIDLEQALSLHGSDKDIWVETAAEQNIMTHYDWDTGNVLQQITLTNDFGAVNQQGDDFLAVNRADDGTTETITHVNMHDGQVSTEEFSGPKSPKKEQMARRQAAQPDGGLPLSPTGEDKPLNPQKVQEQVQNLTLPARIALPALLASSQHQRQINNEMKSEDKSQNPPEAPANTPDQSVDMANVNLIPDGNTFIAFEAELLKENLVTHEAMKAPPKHSVLDSGDVSSGNENEAVNEQLNEMQRNNGGDTVTEDESTYRVAIRRAESEAPDWVGEVTGTPQIFPLQSVDVLTSGKTITVFDKSIKKLWQADLTYEVPGGDSEFGSSQSGMGPCVETNGTLYVYDQAILTAFDLSSGNVRWRIPSVGISGMFFDDRGMIYLNTTDQNLDDIKFSRQIDVTKQNEPVVQKVDPAAGKILWTAKPGGYITYLSGEFIYAYQSYDAGDDDEQLFDGAAGLEKSSYTRLIRISPSNGHVMWQYEEPRAPMDIQFDKDIISIVFKKEVEVLHYFTL